MKRFKVSIIMMLMLMLFTVSCSKKKETYYYIGKGDYWLATYSITEVNHTYYDSLVIQYLVFRDETNEERIGPIEFVLKGNAMELSSTDPQDLKGVASLHTSAAYNAEVIKIKFEKSLILTVTWKDMQETIILNRY
ncbi:MAG: hypothetical protein K0S76_2338 [Herbinix sp.]|jgi:hypothetical protein|nr:hypothetical protein [Herbinix sp.]